MVWKLSVQVVPGLSLIWYFSRPSMMTAHSAMRSEALVTVSGSFATSAAAGVAAAVSAISRTDRPMYPDMANSFEPPRWALARPGQSGRQPRAAHQAPHARVGRADAMAHT